MKKNLLFLLTLLCLFTTKGWAASESLLSYTVDGTSVAEEEIKAGNGTILFGASKFETSTVSTSGYAYKSDGNVGETSTKYALLKPSRALKAGDVIKLTAYATSKPNGSDYGLGLYNERGASEAVKILYLNVGKNTLETLSYTVTEGDGLVGESEIYVFRAPDKSTYICGAEINSADDSGDDPGDDPGDEPGDEPTTFNKTWNFSNWTAGDYTSQTTVDGLTIEASSDKKVTIDGSEKTVDGVSYTQRLKFGGTGDANYRNLHFDVPGNCKITIVGAHASSSGDDRNLKIAAGSFNNVVDDNMKVVAKADPYAYVYHYTGEATTIYIYSANSGINLYAIYAESESGDEPVVTIAKPTFVVDGVTYESGATVEGLKTGQTVTINVEEGMYIYSNWSGKTGNAKGDYYVANRMKGQTTYNASTSSGGQRVLYAVAGDTDDATGNSSDLAYIVFTDVVASNPVFTIEEGEVEAGTTVGIKSGCSDDKIYYTLDGTDPTANSPQYTGEITINETTTIKAIAFDKNGAYGSEIVTATYTVPAQSFSITINRYGLATFYSSKSAYILPARLTATVVESINGKKLNQVEIDGIIPADCAVILEGETGQYTLEPTADLGAAPTNLLRGFDEETLTTGEDPVATYKFYALSAKDGVAGFYWLADNGGAFLCGANKAYLAVPVETAGANSAFILDTTDGIDSIVTATTDAPAYNLAGQRVSDNYKGVVIMGGKKVMK